MSRWSDMGQTSVKIQSGELTYVYLLPEFNIIINEVLYTHLSPYEKG